MKFSKYYTALYIFDLHQHLMSTCP